MIGRFLFACFIWSGLTFLAEGAAPEFAPGEVRDLCEKDAKSIWLAPSNNQTGDKKVAFALIGECDRTIDGRGATLVCHGRVFPFAALGCTNLTIRNLTVTTRYPSCAGFTVTARNESGFDILFDRGVCPYEVRDGNVDFRLDGHVVSTREGRLSLHALDRIAIHYLMTPDSKGDKSEFPSTFVGVRAEDLGQGRLRFRYIGDTHPKSVKLPYGVGERVVINLEERRYRDVFFFEDCRGVTLENVTIRRFGGMGVVAQRSGDLTVRGLVAEPPEGERVSLTADTMQFINCFGRVTVENCRCSHSLDDVINIHGNYLKVVEARKNVLRLRAMHVSHGGFFPYRPGDEIEAVNARTRAVLARARVVSRACVGKDGYECELKLDADLSALPVGSLVENVTLNPNVVLRRNDFHDHPNMRLSGRGKYLIELNRIADSCSAVVGMDLAEYWYESGRISEMILRDNVFSNCNKLGGRSFLSFGVSGWGVNAPKIHGRIVLQNNRFEKVRQAKWSVSGVREFVSDGIRGN